MFEEHAYQETLGQKSLSLNDIKRAEETASVPINVQITNNCGERTLLFSMSMNTFHSRFHCG